MHLYIIEVGIIIQEPSLFHINRVKIQVCWVGWSLFASYPAVERWYNSFCLTSLLVWESHTIWWTHVDPLRELKQDFTASEPWRELLWKLLIRCWPHPTDGWLNRRLAVFLLMIVSNERWQMNIKLLNKFARITVKQNLKVYAHWQFVYMCLCEKQHCHFLGRLFWVNLIKWVSNVHLFVRVYIRTSAHPQIVSLISVKFGM